MTYPTTADALVHRRPLNLRRTLLLIAGLAATIVVVLQVIHSSGPQHTGGGPAKTASGTGGGSGANGTAPTTSTTTTTTTSVPTASPPRTLLAVSENRSVFLSWRPPVRRSAHGRGYAVLRGNDQIATVKGTMFTDASVHNGVKYTYRVVALESGGLVSPHRMRSA